MELKYSTVTTESNTVIDLNELVRHSDFSGEHFGYILKVLCNRYGTQEIARKAALQILEDHPSLQQSIIRLFIEIMVAMSNHSQYTDPRNENALNLCHRVAQLKKDGFINLPMV